MCPTGLYSPNVILGMSPEVCQQSCDKGTLGLLGDAYGNVLCLSACWHDAECGIRCAQVLASKTTRVPEGGNENAGDVGESCKRRSFYLVYAGRIETFLAFTSSCG